MENGTWIRIGEYEGKVIEMFVENIPSMGKEGKQNT